jgi:hypothetical protein
MKKSHAKATLSSPRESKPPRNQAIASLVTPIKGGVMNQIGENKKKQRNMDSVRNPFTFLRETINAWDNGKARCFASVSLGETVM